MGIQDFSINKSDWYFPEELKEKINTNILSFTDKTDRKLITLVPSAAWPMKRWPVGHWQKLVLNLPDYKFMILADLMISSVKKLRKLPLVEF